MEVVWNTCDMELGGEMKSMKTTSKIHLKPSKSHPL